MDPADWDTDVPGVRNRGDLHSEVVAEVVVGDDVGSRAIKGVLVLWRDAPVGEDAQPLPEGSPVDLLLRLVAAATSG